MTVVEKSWRPPWSKARPLRRALFFSLIDGLTASAGLGIVDQFIIPYALEMGFSQVQIGLLASLPFIMASISQLASPHVVAWQGRRRPFCILTVFLQAFWILTLVFVWHLPIGPRVYAAILGYTLLIIFGTVQAGPWGSWMADLVPDDSRSRYFGWRSQIMGLFALPCVYFAAVFLDAFSANPFIGYGVVFSIAAGFRFISGLALVYQYEPPMEPEPVSQRVGFFEFLSGRGNRDILSASLYLAAITFATRLAGPFFAVFMRRDLGLSYRRYAILGLTFSLVLLIFMRSWGHIGARVGNAKLLKFSWPGIVIIPFLWILNSNFYYLMVLQALSGFVWGAYFLASWTYLLDASSPETRARYVSYSMIMTGIAGSAGPILGGFIAPHLPALRGFDLRSLFAVSAVLRLLAGVLTLPRLREVRHVPGLGVEELVYALPGVRPLSGLYREFVRRFM